MIILTTLPSAVASKLTSSIRFSMRKIPQPRVGVLPSMRLSISGAPGLPTPRPRSCTATSRRPASAVNVTPTRVVAWSLFPCSMALMQASATAVLRSSTRSAGKFIFRATSAATSMADFSAPSLLGKCSSSLCCAAMAPRHDNSNVVVLLGAGGEAPDVLEELVEKRGWLELAVRLHGIKEAIEAVKFLIRIHRLHPAVGVEHDHAAFGQAERGFLVLAIGHDAKREGVAGGGDVPGRLARHA